jgi:hypothetical protein
MSNENITSESYCIHKARFYIRLYGTPLPFVTSVTIAGCSLTILIGLVSLGICLLEYREMRARDLLDDRFQDFADNEFLDDENNQPQQGDMNKNIPESSPPAIQINDPEDQVSWASAKQSLEDFASSKGD